MFKIIFFSSCHLYFDVFLFGFWCREITNHSNSTVNNFPSSIAACSILTWCVQTVWPAIVYYYLVYFLNYFVFVSIQLLCLRRRRWASPLTFLNCQTPLPLPHHVSLFLPSHISSSSLSSLPSGLLTCDWPRATRCIYFSDHIVLYVKLHSDWGSLNTPWLLVLLQVSIVTNQPTEWRAAQLSFGTVSDERSQHLPSQHPYSSSVAIPALMELPALPSA